MGESCSVYKTQEHLPQEQPWEMANAFPGDRSNLSIPKDIIAVLKDSAIRPSQTSHASGKSNVDKKCLHLLALFQTAPADDCCQGRRC